MCGRFAQTTKPKTVAEKFKIHLKVEMDEFQPRYNVSPSSMVPCIRIPSGETKPVLENLKWGLIPSWAKDPKIGFKLANARAETVAELPSFRTSFKNQRCLVPIDGFYEWNQTTQPKQPYYFHLKNEEPFCLAGLWDIWKFPAGDVVNTFTLITTEPNAVVAPVCDRMPVILDEKDFEAWLDPKNQDTAQLKALLKAYPASAMEGYPVSSYVSKAGNEGSMCVVKINLPK
jgi:putative SOS response-associated peptidase YedK